MATRQNTRLPIALDRAAHMIGLAGRDAARGEHQIVAAAASRDRARERVRIVRQDAEIGDARAPSRVEQAAPADSGWRRTSRRAARGAPGSTISSPVENIATRKPPPHRELGKPERGGERDVLRRRARVPAGSTDRARLAHPRRRAGGWRRASGPAARPPLPPSRRHVLLHEHGVGARRHRRAGENADRLARPERRAAAAARRSPGRRSAGWCRRPASRSAWRTA